MQHEVEESWKVKSEGKQGEEKWSEDQQSLMVIRRKNGGSNSSSQQK